MRVNFHFLKSSILVTLKKNRTTVYNAMGHIHLANLMFWRKEIAWILTWKRTRNIRFCFWVWWTKEENYYYWRRIVRDKVDHWCFIPGKSQENFTYLLYVSVSLLNVPAWVVCGCQHHHHPLSRCSLPACCCFPTPAAVAAASEEPGGTAGDPPRTESLSTHTPIITEHFPQPSSW